jgi:hypothetical protein
MSRPFSVVKGNCHHSSASSPSRGCLHILTSRTQQPNQTHRTQTTSKHEPAHKRHAVSLSIYSFMLKNFVYACPSPSRIFHNLSKGWTNCVVHGDKWGPPIFSVCFPSCGPTWMIQMFFSEKFTLILMFSVPCIFADSSSNIPPICTYVFI